MERNTLESLLTLDSGSDQPWNLTDYDITMPRGLFFAFRCVQDSFHGTSWPLCAVTPAAVEERPLMPVIPESHRHSPLSDEVTTGF